MDTQQETGLSIAVEGRTILARPRPEDQATLAELLARGASITLQQSSADTEGHGYGLGEITVEVEGHAMTLRLPNAGDAEALKRALAIGALTASVAVGGFVAGTIAGPVTAPQVNVPPITVPQAAPIAQPRVDVNQDIGLADWASEKAAEEFAKSVKTFGLPAQAPRIVTTTTSGEGADQDINLSQRGRPAAANEEPAPAPPQPNRDLGSHAE